MASAGAGNWRSTAVTWESFRKTTMIGHAQQRGAAPSYLKISRTSSGILADGRPLLRWSRFDEAVPQVAVWWNLPLDDRDDDPHQPRHESPGSMAGLRG